MIPPEVRAETITITGGSASVFEIPGRAGSSFSIANAAVGFAASGFRERSTRGTGVGSFNIVPNELGSATINGSFFQIVNWDGSTGLRFTSAPLSFVDPGTGALFVDVQSTFTMEGLLVGHTPTPNGLAQVLNTFFVGQGTTTGRYQLNFMGIPGYTLTSVRYDFQPAPVPEPATLLLLGTGLAGAAASYRRRRRNESSR